MQACGEEDGRGFFSKYEAWVLRKGKSRVFHQQCKLMGSSAQDSSGVRCCWRRVRFNKVPEKVPNIPEGGFGAEPNQVQQGPVKSSGEGSGEGLGGFGGEITRVPEKVPEKVWEALVQIPAGSGEGLRSFGAEPGQVQQGSKEGSGEGLGGFGAELRQVQQGSGRRFPRRCT